MSAIASSSTAAVSSTSNGTMAYSNPPKRRSGTFRVVAEDCSQFTLDDEFDNDFHEVLAECERYAGISDPVLLDEPLIATDRSSSSDYSHKNMNKDSSRTSSVSHHEREISRLTDEVEIDGDSASDELDLLPPLPPCSGGGGRKFLKWKVKVPNSLLCCNRRVPAKCDIM